MSPVLKRLTVACSVRRPDRFVDAVHCAECATHEETLQRTTPDQIAFSVVESPGFNPVPFMSQEAFVYFLPGLARLALGRGDHYYFDGFLSSLTPVRIAALAPNQRVALVEFVEFAGELLRAEIAANCTDEDLEEARRRLAA